MKEETTLICTANSSVDSEFIAKGEVRSWPREMALRLLSSNRFEETDPAKTEKPVSRKPSQKKAAAADD